MLMSHVKKIAQQLAHRLGTDTSGCTPPCQQAVARLLTLARKLIFPSRFQGGSETAQERLTALLERFSNELEEQVQRALAVREYATGAPGGKMTAATICRRVIERLPDVQRSLEQDVEAAMKGDPALVLAEEAIACYPGVLAVSCFRLAHELEELDVPLLPRMIMSHAHALTGIDIHPAAQIGSRFFIDHGTGVVIGATAVIGDHVRIYQGVTLGAKSFPVDGNGGVIKGAPRHPILEDEVIVYAGASILGRVTIGRGSVIGGNVWITHDVPPGSSMKQARPRHVEFANGGGI